MIKYRPLTASQYGTRKYCIQEEYVLYDKKEQGCLIKTALERYIDNSYIDINKKGVPSSD